jgi:hypothetical protein
MSALLKAMGVTIWGLIGIAQFEKATVGST